MLKRPPSYLLKLHLKNTMLTLDVLIATHTPEGILRVADMNLPVVDGVRYIVSSQDHRDAEIPMALETRHDVTVDRFGQ
ncbi:MAG: hypothetical protein K2G71_04680, partial [Duncaniella sp.]|nr:hypothetical protein [Duncaniella sp.]